MSKGKGVIEDADSGNAGNNMAETVLNAMAIGKSKKPKKKGKKKKTGFKTSTKALKILERQNKLVEMYKSDMVRYDKFVDRIDKWFEENMAKFKGLFTILDKEQTGEITYDQFKAGLLDFDVPCSAIELHLLCRLLDTDGNLAIDFGEFDKGIRYFRDLDRIINGVVEAESSPYRDTDNTIKLLDQDKRWINCEIILVSFEEYPEHTSHLKVLTNPTSYVDHLINIISRKKHLLASTITIYRNSTCSAEMILPRNLTLEDCGFKGGDSYRPKDLKLYYDFYPDDLGDSPIILAGFADSL